jgi:hypothetical protein
MFNFRSFFMARAAAAVMAGMRFTPPLPTREYVRPRRYRPHIGRTQELIADRSSSISKLQRSPIPLMEGDERTLRRHIHPRSKRNAR